MKRLSILTSILLISCSSPVKVDSTRQLASDDATNRIKECELMRDSYYKFIKKDVDVSCNSDYHLYEAKSFKDEKTEKVKMGSFNIYKINHGVTRFKNLNIISKIFLEEKWDMVAVQEVFPMSGDIMDANLEWAKMDDKFKAESAHAELLRVPTYLHLLSELQKADPKSGWSFILSNVANGATESSLEQAGYYFKKSTLKLVENEYCKEYGLASDKDKKFGCLQALSGFEKETVSRPPFIASFASDTFDYIALTLHARFRLPKDPNKAGSIDQALVDKVFKTYLGDTPPKMGEEELYRAAEMKIVVKSMKEIADMGEEKDVILMGDFNLEHPRLEDVTSKKVNKNTFEQNQKMWNIITSGYEGSEVFGFGESSVSMKNRLASNYDHFIYKPAQGFTSECGEVLVYDFTDPKFPHFKEFLDKKNWDRLTSEYEEVVKSKKLIFRGKVQAEFKAEEVKKEVEEYKKRLFSSQSSTAKKYQMHQELISDHLPVYAECKSTEDDD
jgi:hypothetical protein